jgi:ABC-type glycerol-3-phosphate transport system substrate-binding protein
MTIGRMVRDQSGGVLVTVAVALPMLVMLGSFVIDAGNWWVHKRHLQTQADAAALAGAGALAGCSSDGSGAKGSKAATTITYWDWYASQAGWVDNEIKLFQDAHPGVVVKKTTQVSDKYADLVSLAYRSNNAPDILMVPKSPQLSQQISQGWLMPLDKWATDS